VPDSPVRYDPEFELHVYRIVEQACENAVRHAQAASIEVQGRLEPGRIDLTIADDGVGFPAGQQLDLVGLVATKHFGLVSMFERAAVAKAQMEIDSAPQQGARINIQWAADNPA
jgi:signal transduction histidine kinase